MSALVSTTARTGLCRSARGQRAGVAASCVRTSGEALKSTQRSPSADTQSDDWLRGRTSSVRVRAETQRGQPQFHWGSPPPAAEPRTMARMEGVVAEGGREQAGECVRADLGAGGELDEIGLLPGAGGGLLGSRRSVRASRRFVFMGGRLLGKR